MSDETGDLHRLQWWDPDWSYWRDSELDALLKERAKGEARGKLEERIAGMRSLLEIKLPGALLAQLKANWRRAGQGHTMAEVAEVSFGNADWSSLLFPQELNGNGEDKPPGRVRRD